MDTSTLHLAAVAFRFDQRVHAAGDPARVGAVRYLGVEGHPGDLVGVDWDAGAGGRHEGSLAGRRYFVAAGERSASFARPAGVTLVDALRSRYRVDDFTKEEQDEIYAFSTNQKRVSVELVGKNKVQEKLKDFNDLTSASVSYMGISPHERRKAEIRYVRLVMGKAETYDPEEIKRLQPRFTELKAFHGIEDDKPISRISGGRRLISITLKCIGPSMGEKQPLTKKLPSATA
ncbi:hypothetical protein E2562_025752, partial [Oryza meyeriana var. granulata]